jgi:hypothetical protein
VLAVCAVLVSLQQQQQQLATIRTGRYAAAALFVGPKQQLPCDKQLPSYMRHWRPLQQLQQ